MGEKYLYSKFVDITENAPGKVVVVTGANSGLGFETARSLAKANAVVVLACRSEKRGKEAVQKILSRGHLSPDKVLYMHLDLASLDSVRAFAVALTEKFKSIDVLVNNAESQMAVNHLSHFLLTSLLLPYMAENGRIINHSSLAHSYAEKNFTYANSKMANLLFTYELNKRLKASGNPKNIIRATATNLISSGSLAFLEKYAGYVLMSSLDGSLSQTLAAVGPDVRASVNTYIGPNFFVMGSPSVTRTNKQSWNAEQQKLLWERSLKLTQADYHGL
eukprot:gene29919-39090_t